MTDRPETDDGLPAFETLCAHWAEDPSRFHGAVIPPIFQNSLFTNTDCETRERMWAANAQRPMPNAHTGGTPEWTPPEFYDYTRVANPTTDITEAKIAVLEKGEKARCFGSGMAAISAAILSCVKAGDHVIAPDTAYGPTRQFLTDYLPRFGVETTIVDGRDPQDYADALRPNTTLFYLETPGTAVFQQQDIAAIVSIAQAHGAATICDNSWATPYFQNPLRHGVDLVVHSATKYLGGHSDVVAGVAVGSAERMARLIWNEGLLLGAVLDPFASWLLLRGLRTLPIRMERHQLNARRVALALREHNKVARVFYPGLDDDRQADLTQKQLRGTSGLLSIAFHKQDRESVYRFVNHLRYFSIGCSWGGFESLAIPMTISARFLDGPASETRWIVRLHIGLENADDLLNDLCDALAVL